MKSKILFTIILAIPFLSCNTALLLKETMTINDLLAKKETIDQSQNPAEVLLLKKELSEKILILEDVKVKDIINSTNVDYDFCVLADIQTDKGLIECYIYSIDVNRISKLKRGQSIITVKGIFKRYFSMLDDYYTKIEITNSRISIKND